jgi:hypothetical protein
MDARERLQKLIARSGQVRLRRDAEQLIREAE